jgi:hypothetical protein
MKPNAKKLALLVTHWLARLFVLGVFLLGGAFFVDHTREWFLAPWPQLPPLKVCAFQALHLLLLAGLLASLWWSRLGLVWVSLAAGAFFLPAAGARALVFVGLTILPVLLLAFCDRLKHRDTPRLHAA